MNQSTFQWWSDIGVEQFNGGKYILEHKGSFPQFTFMDHDIYGPMI